MVAKCGRVVGRLELGLVLLPVSRFLSVTLTTWILFHFKLRVGTVSLVQNLAQ